LFSFGIFRSRVRGHVPPDFKQGSGPTRCGFEAGVHPAKTANVSKRVDIRYPRCPLVWTARPGDESVTASAEPVTLDQVVDVRTCQIEPLGGLRDIPAGRLERFLEQPTLKAVGLLLKTEVFVAGLVVRFRFEMKMRRFDLQEPLSCCGDDRGFDGV